MDMRMIGTLIVFTAVFSAVAIRYATDYTPDDPLRRWSTRIAVLTIFVWIIFGFFARPSSSGTFNDYLFGRYLLRGVFAIAVIWFAFRDEL